MNTKQAHLAVSAIVCLIAALMFLPSLAQAAEDTSQKVKTSMALLQSEAEKLVPYQPNLVISRTESDSGENHSVRC